jgi:hypothetical protein
LAGAHGDTERLLTTIDAVRALSGTVKSASESIARTNAALGIETSLT